MPKNDDEPRTTLLSDCWFENHPPEHRIPICEKCTHALTMPMADSATLKGREFIGCERHDDIASYADAKELCPILRHPFTH